MDQDETGHACRPPHCMAMHIVLDGDPAPPPTKGHSPQFSAHICCGQMAGWIKIPLSRKIGLGPSDIVLDGDPAPSPQKRGRPHPQFGPCLLWPKGLDGSIKMALGMRVGLGPWPHCARWGPSSPSAKRGHTPNLRPISILAKRLDASRCLLAWRSASA